MKDSTAERPEAVAPGASGEAHTTRAAEVRRGPVGADGLEQVDVIPAARVAASRSAASGSRPRPVGPGRKERAYLQRIADAERELETAKLLERGTNRMLDRLEREAVEARRMERKLAFALGALQAQNQALRAQLEARGESPQLGR